MVMREGGHRRRKPVHVYKAHVVTDQDAALIETVDRGGPLPAIERESRRCRLPALAEGEVFRADYRASA
jgi:hypothetical protein